MQPTNSYLIGAMLDPLVAEFMSPAYCKGMLEAKIRMDEQQRMNCPPRAGFVCVVDPRVQSGHYYRKHVAGEGINARPPSRLEQAVQRQNENPPRQGLSTLSKVAIAGLIGVGGLAGLGAIANSGRSLVDEPIEATAPTAPKTPTAPKASPAYTSSRQQALLMPRLRRMGSNNDVIDNGVITTLPKDSPLPARRKRSFGQGDQIPVTVLPDPSVQVASPPIANPTLNQPIPPWSPSLQKPTRSQPATVAPSIATPSPVIPVATPATSTTSPKAVTVAPAIATPTPLAVKPSSNSAIKNAYASNAIPDDARKPGYKTTSALNAHLKKLGVIKNNEEFAAMLDNDTLVDRGLLVQRSSNDGSLGGFGKDNTRSIRIPAFTPPETLIGEGATLANNREKPVIRLPKVQNLKEAITEKLNDPNLTDAQRANLMTSRDNATIQIARINVSIAKNEARSPVVPPSPLGTGLQNKVLETRASELAKKVHESVNAGTGQAYLKALTNVPDVDKSLVSKKLKDVQKKIEDPYTQEFLADYHNNVFIVGTKISRMPTPKIENEDDGIFNGDFVQARAKVEPAIAPPVVETPKAPQEKYVAPDRVKKLKGAREIAAEKERKQALDVLARAQEKAAEAAPQVAPTSKISRYVPPTPNPLVGTQPPDVPFDLEGTRTHRMLDLTSGFNPREKMEAVQVGDRVIGGTKAGIGVDYAIGGIVTHKLVTPMRQGEVVAAFAKDHGGEENTVTAIHYGGFAIKPERINVSKDGEYSVVKKVSAAPVSDASVSSKQFNLARLGFPDPSFSREGKAKHYRDFADESNRLLEKLDNVGKSLTDPESVKEYKSARVNLIIDKAKAEAEWNTLKSVSDPKDRKASDVEKDIKDANGFYDSRFALAEGLHPPKKRAKQMRLVEADRAKMLEDLNEELATFAGNVPSTPNPLVEEKALLKKTEDIKFKSPYFEIEMREETEDLSPSSVESLEIRAKSLEGILEKLKKTKGRRFSAKEKKEMGRYGILYGDGKSSSSWRWVDQVEAYQEDLLNEIERRKNTAKKQNNDSIASHSTYSIAREKAKQQFLRRVA
jgi:hypothetical protein